MITTTEYEIDMMLRRKLAAAEEILENLKCCGNCRHFLINPLNCDLDVYPAPEHRGKCDKWAMEEKLT